MPGKKKTPSKPRPKPKDQGNEKRLKALGKKLKAIRESKGLTLKELAYPIGKEPQSLSRVEQGEINPSYLYLVSVCESLGIELSDLVKDLEK